MLRYLRRLSDQDLALDRTMIPLGSCTMKLNATTEMEPITWPEFAGLHPFAPLDQADGLPRADRPARGAGWARSPATTRCRCSRTPARRASSPGCSRSAPTTGPTGRTGARICLIPSSAHGTNAASAVMAGMRVVVVAYDDERQRRPRRPARQGRRAPRRPGRDDDDLPVDARRLRAGHRPSCARSCTTPAARCTSTARTSTRWSGVARPGQFGADVSHLNLHKTFCIPHGGGGPGRRSGRRARAPRAVPAQPPAAAGRRPGDRRRAGLGRAVGIGRDPADLVGLRPADGRRGADPRRPRSRSCRPTTSRPGSAPHYPVLYTGRGGLVAHECIVDLRADHQGDRRHRRRRRQAADRLRLPRADDVVPGRRHADDRADRVRGPRRARPVLRRDDRDPRRDRPGRLAGSWTRDDNPLRDAPHTAAALAGEWAHPYSREPRRSSRPGSTPATKYWPPVRRIDGAYGDRNLVCSCPPVEALRATERGRRSGGVRPRCAGGRWGGAVR